MTLTAEQATQRAADRPHQRGPITRLQEFEESWEISLDSTGFLLFKEKLGDVPPPQVGDEITLYTVQWSVIRGVDLRGEPLYYKTEAELETDRIEAARKREEKQKQEFEEHREERDAAFESLPAVFQRRVQWFRDHNPSFRWDLEPYEMSSCVDAVRIAETMKTLEGVKEYGDADHGRQRELVPDVQYERHSGNSFDFACRLAQLYLIDPLLVVAEHGAMTPLTGCEDYGCAHPREDDVLAAVAAWAEREGQS